MNRKQTPPYDSTPLSAIEVSFAIPTYITNEERAALDALLDIIVHRPYNQPEEGPHWLSGCGGKPQWSKADAAFLNISHSLTAPETGEPEIDMETLWMETSAREWHEGEKESALRRRERYKLARLAKWRKTLEALVRTLTLDNA